MEISRIYPVSLKMARTSRAVEHLTILRNAVSEMGGQFPARMRHVQAVATTREALASKNINYFLEILPENLIENEMARCRINRHEFNERYSFDLRSIFELHDSFSPLDKAVLELAVWAHDLGIPFGVEWEHPQNGAEVVRELITDEEIARPVAMLVGHHGEYSNLVSASFPRDIYQLPRQLQKMLLVLDFCDATSRLDANGEQYNPIGLRTLRLYKTFTTEQGLIRLEDPAQLFELRCDYGFGPLIFPQKEIDQVTIRKLFQALSELSPAQDEREIVEFFGSQFRCNFLDLLITALKSPEDRANLFANIYDTYRTGDFVGDVLLWPDIDLGRVLHEDPQIFKEAFQKRFTAHGIHELLIPMPMRGKLLLMVSKILPQTELVF